MSKPNCPQRYPGCEGCPCIRKHSETHKKPRQGGKWKGKVKIAPDFDELPDSFMAAFRAGKRLMNRLYRSIACQALEFTMLFMPKAEENQKVAKRKLAGLCVQTIAMAGNASVQAVLRRLHSLIASLIIILRPS